MSVLTFLMACQFLKSLILFFQEIKLELYIKLCIIKLIWSMTVLRKNTLSNRTVYLMCVCVCVCVCARACECASMCACVCVCRGVWVWGCVEVEGKRGLQSGRDYTDKFSTCSWRTFVDRCFQRVS